MRKMMTTALVLTAMSGAMAMAQTNTGASGQPKAAPPASASPDQRLAPIGHRQPRLTDATADTDINKIDPEDAALNRKLRSICRGC
jgi:hypothetical protein